MTQRVVLPPSTRAQEWSQQKAIVSTDEKAELAVDRKRLARAVGELAVDLATVRRDCRDKRQRIDSLQAEIARLLAATSAATRDQRSPRQGSSCQRRVSKPGGARRCARAPARHSSQPTVPTGSLPTPGLLRPLTSRAYTWPLPLEDTTPTTSVPSGRIDRVLEGGLTPLTDTPVVVATPPPT
jgi:hypothetical protein